VKGKASYSSLFNTAGILGWQVITLAVLSHALLSCPLNPAAIAAQSLARTVLIHLADDEAGQTRWLHHALAINLYTNHLGGTINQYSMAAPPPSAAPTLRPPVSHHSRPALPPSSSLSRFLVPTSHFSPSCKYIPRYLYRSFSIIIKRGTGDGSGLDTLLRHTTTTCVS
jgi:hypothetical protein